MQIVIDIPENIYDAIMDDEMISREQLAVLEKHIYYGTPLPKGHGRLLDEKDILDTENNGGGWYDLVDMPEYIAEVKAIIEADTE